MKTVHTDTKRRGGFTLIEVLTVIVILALLATLGWTALGLVNNRKLRQMATIQVEQLTTGMNNYRTDYGDVLPAGSGDAWSSHSLYSVLYSDADNDGRQDVVKETGERLAPYCSSIVLISGAKGHKEELNGIPATKVSIKVPHTRKKKKMYVLIDPWGGMFYYRLGFNMKDSEGNFGQGMNPDFDIFSRGPDDKGDSRSHKGDNADNISNIRTWK